MEVDVPVQILGVSYVQWHMQSAIQKRIVENQHSKGQLPIYTHSSNCNQVRSTLEANRVEDAGLAKMLLTNRPMTGECERILTR